MFVSSILTFNAWHVKSVSQSRIMKYKNCQYCNDELEIHHITLHERLCCLNVSNLTKIAALIEKNVLDIKKLNKNNFLKFSKAEKILSPITLIKRFGVDSWEEALYQLAVYSSLAGLLQFELTEILLFQLSHSTLWMNNEEFKAQTKKCLTKEIDTQVVDGDSLYLAYQRLLTAIIIRAQMDVAYNDGEYRDGENDIFDAADFLLDFCPEVFENLVISDDIQQYIAEKI